jgi:hypothetical protein
MSKVKEPTSRRVTVAVGMYLALVIVASAAFYWMRSGISPGSPIRYALILCGSALALFTHMSYILFGLQSLLLVPWLLLGAYRPQAKLIAATGFCVCWLGIGWYMHDLF